MPYDELLKWVSFFENRPSGWREDQRTYMIMASMGAKGKPEEYFPSLAMMKAQQEKLRLKQEEDKITPVGLFLNKMLSAKKGDDSGWKPTWSGSNGGKPSKS
jgi:hypothetical protein